MSPACSEPDGGWENLLKVFQKFLENFAHRHLQERSTNFCFICVFRKKKLLNPSFRFAIYEKEIEPK